eukprot:1589991-Rhodomonas_salina.1
MSETDLSFGVTSSLAQYNAGQLAYAPMRIFAAQRKSGSGLVLRDRYELSGTNIGHAVRYKGGGGGSDREVCELRSRNAKTGGLRKCTNRAFEGMEHCYMLLRPKLLSQFMFLFGVVFSLSLQ